MDWKHHAAALADEVCGPGPQWHAAVSKVPRHKLLPRWWNAAPGCEWRVYDGPSDEGAWMAYVYADRPVVTEVAGVHADHADGQPMSAYALPTSSSSMPSRVISMLCYARVREGADVLIVGTGSGYSTALASHLLGTRHVTAIDVSPYVTASAADRLRPLGIMPSIVTGDATQELPGTYDCIVSMTSVWPVPASWLTALRPGGRLATSLAGTPMILTAGKAETGEWAATGRIEWEPAGFMPVRTGGDTGAALHNVRDTVDGMADGEVTTGRHPVINVRGSRDLAAMMAISVPGIQHAYSEASDGGRTAWMLAGDGSWAKAADGDGDERPVVTQGGPRRLWDILDDHRDRWLSRGSLPAYGATARVRADGTVWLFRDGWSAPIA